MRPYYTMHTDAGHGWLAVPADDVFDLGLSAQSFSCYSYKKQNDWYYLEEDCDAGTFIDAFRRKHDAMPNIRISHTDGNSPIRRYRRLMERA